MIGKIRKILYATDFTTKSINAFPFAVDFARLHNAKIVILHAIEPLPGIVTMHSDLKSEKAYYRHVRESSEEKIRARIESECQKLEELTGSPCTSLISNVLTPVGKPVEEILANADREECDMIVMGTRGKDSLKDTILGSVAQLVLQKTRKPVLVVPLPVEQESVLQGKTILVVDDEPDVREVIEEEILEAAPNCTVDTVGSYEEAAELLTSHNYDLAILDVMGVRGFDLLKIAVDRPHPIPVVILTAQAHSAESLKKSIEMGARAYLPKEKLGDIVRHLEDVMTYEYGPAWKRLLKEITGHLYKGWGPYWRQPDEAFWKEFDRKIDSEQ
jgi:nucleotide-binding universal stress UspA family protein/CheY-like chemotaxis protein